ncbi:MAG: hypothetical protein CMM01_00335 [Rhodopirellula sp.]|nr:hypothetical protein [Rhodopirellula sp.]
MRSGTRPRPQANILPLLVDNSRSMLLKTDVGEESRRAQVTRIVDEDSGWRRRLAQAFDVRSYLFDSRLESVDQLSAFDASGYSSSLAGSLQSLSERFASRPVAGVLLFSDGNLTDLPTGDADWSKLGFPVYPVLPSNDGDYEDLRIADVSVGQTDFESAPTTVTITLDSDGMDGQTAFVRLAEAGSGKLIEEQQVKLGGNDEQQEARFRFRPEKTGVSFYRATVFTERDRGWGESLTVKAEVNAAATGSSLTENAAEDESEYLADEKVGPVLTADPTGEKRGVLGLADAREAADTLETDIRSSEATLMNNQRIVTVDRATGPYRILYVAGRPNWEFKFLRRALQEDAEVQLVALLRIANKEAKFSFRDKSVNSTNPLFAGLGEDEEEAAQQYDEPVIIRLGVKESEELSEGFPETAEELFAYHGVVLDDIETSFFTQDQMLLLRKFVAARGGGLLMLGGSESFASDKFADSPLGELSPVYAPRSGKPSLDGPFAIELTREGLLQPWVRLRDTEAAEKDRVRGMPSFLTVNQVGDVKPGASQLATVTVAGDRKAPALIAQRFGKGRTAALTVGDMWRWSMRRNDAALNDDAAALRDDPAQAWRQLSHWLVNDVPRRVDVRVETGDDPSKPVTVVVTVRDEEYLPLDNASVELVISPMEGEPFVLKADMDDNEAGKYLATYWSREPGGYSLTVTVTAADGTAVGLAKAGWTSDAGAAEFRELKLNRELLQQIADQTGGEVISESDLAGFAEDLPNRDVPVTETWIYPIWHRPWVMFLAILCLCCEWGLRRWKGLA